MEFSQSQKNIFHKSEIIRNSEQSGVADRGRG